MSKIIIPCIKILNHLNITKQRFSFLTKQITENKLVKITDMLGQETPFRRNTTLFYIYDDGTVDKKITIE